MTQAERDAQMRGLMSLFLRLPLAVQIVALLIGGGGITGGTAALMSGFTMGPRLEQVEDTLDDVEETLGDVAKRDTLQAASISGLKTEVTSVRIQTRIQSDYLACLNDPGAVEDIRAFCRMIRDQVHRNLDDFRANGR